MLKQEFEKLVGMEVLEDQYEAIETLYYKSSLFKREFATLIRPLVKHLYRPQPPEKMKVKIWNGYEKPIVGEVINVNVKSGKLEVKILDNYQGEVKHHVERKEVKIVK